MTIIHGVEIDVLKPFQHTIKEAIHNNLPIEEKLHVIAVVSNPCLFGKQLENNVNKAIEKVKPENYKNYFEHAYNLKEGIKLHRKPSTRRRKLKNYK